jgi:glutathione S-transferase
MNFLPKDKKPVEVINYLQKRNDTALAVLESHLSGKNWVAADQLSAADLSCCSYLFYREEFGFDRKSHPNIDRWLSNIEELENWKHPYDLLERAYPPK